MSSFLLHFSSSAAAQPGLPLEFLPHGYAVASWNITLSNNPSHLSPCIYLPPFLSHLLHTLITRLPPFALRTFHRHHLYTFPHSTNSNFKRSLFSLLSNRFLLCVETDHSTRKGFLATTPRRRENAQGWLVALAHNFLLLPSFL